MISMKFDRYQKRLYLSKGILQGACPCLLPGTVLGHVLMNTAIKNNPEPVHKSSHMESHYASWANYLIRIVRELSIDMPYLDAWR